ncbi:hypothetical protein [Chryseobacterium limigenitum]|nr:hypothetical protein [Chryseobacterium limigenitum]
MSLIKGGKLAASFGLGTDPETGCVDNPDKCTAKDNDPCGDTASVPAP